MNLTKLKYFMAVCSQGSLSNASEYLHISQPTLSSVIKELEREYGVSLFMRHKSGMELTREGDILYKLAEDLIEKAKRADEKMRELGKERRRLTIGVPPMIGSLCLAKIFGEFIQDNPDIKIEIIESGREELLEEVRCERIDGAFIPHDLPVDDKYCPVHIGRLETVLCAYKDNPVLNYESISPKQLEGLDLVLFEDGFLHTEKIKRWFEMCGATPKILLQTSQLSTIVSIIREKTAVGFLFRELIFGHPELSARPLEAPMFTDVSFILKRGEYPTDALKRLSEFIKETKFF